ncbi:MAG TPA: oligosaccharide flippase family protein, partial [Thermoleophilaceae bacterium]|nr:oligosaccharide flippase family protein [Thermoleophilaceae bacterium]
MTDPEGAPSAAEVRRRATGGAALLVARGSVILGLGVVANVLLARLLVPRDFGVVALGTVLLRVGGFLADGGLGAGLIRRAEPPSRRELEVVNAAQIALTIAVAAIAAGLAIPLGDDGLVVAAMVATLPVTILKVPSIIVLERDLAYRAIAVADLLEALAFYVVTLAAVLAGAGVWGFAAGMAARAAAGALVMARLGPVGLVRPRWSWPHLRPLLRFGAKFQAVTVTNLVRDQGLNVGIAVVGGVSTLGVWNLAWRVLQAPYMVFGTLSRIGYPTMARLLGAGQDPKPVVERGIAALSVVTGGIMVAVTGIAPALPVVLGSGWGDVPAVLLWSGIALILSLPIYLTSYGYLFATDRGGTVLTVAIAGTVVWLAVSLSLVPAVGAAAAGIGWCASALTQLVLLAPRVTAHSGAAVVRSIAVPTAAAVA